ncbi:class IV lanthionine synthetase subunit LxmK [Nocardiopsis sp. CNT-189]|uniref:class V lanthionine synthetase subunit LxmK n=1 Tax=Nocardiopsis oceanisediminis TaxID=2816862 RepID=UPI003B37EE1A
MRPDPSSPIVAEYGTGLVRTRITREGEGCYLWSRTAGREDGPSPSLAPEPLLARLPLHLPSSAAEIAVGLPADGGVRYRLRGHRTLAELLIGSGGANASPGACRALRSVGSTLRALHLAGLPEEGGKGQGAHRRPPALGRLRSWLRPALPQANAPGERLRAAAFQRLGTARWERMASWCTGMLGLDGPGAEEVLLHGAPSMGTIVLHGGGTQILSGEALAAGAAEYDVGWILGEITEITGFPAALTGGPDREDSAGETLADALSDGYGAPLDGTLLARMAALRVALHMHDFATAVGWADQLEEYLDPLAELLDTAQGADGVASPRTGPPERYLVAPAPLTGAPDVNRVLAELGLGRMEGSSLVSFSGRNDNWRGTTDTGAAVFVKRILPESGTASPSFDRSVAFERLVQAAPESAPPAPHCLGWDQGTGLIVWEGLASTASAAVLADEDRFTEAHARRAGRILGTLHSMRSLPEAAVDTSPPAMPPMEWAEALPLELYLSSSMAELEAWNLIQQDRELVSALRRLRSWEAEAPRTPAHCDFRLDQLILEGSRMLLSDWEEFRIADPARDVGAFAGEWLYRAATGGPRGHHGGGLPGPDPDGDPHTGIISRTRAKFIADRPLVEALWQGYRSARDPDPGFAERAAAWAGWYLFERLIATARERPRLFAGVKAAAGIGRRALLTPADAAPLLGLAARPAPTAQEAHR